MSDIRKLIDTINEMATTSGSVAAVAQPMGGVKSRKKDSIFYEGEKCTACGCEPCKCEDSNSNTVDGTKTPQAPKVSEFGLWKNSALIGKEQREKKKKKAVKENKAVPYEGDREYNALDDVQDQIAKMAHRHKDEKWTMDDYKRLGKKLAQHSSKTKLDELGNSLMPGGQRSLHLAQETFVDPRNSRRHPGAVDEDEQQHDLFPRNAMPVHEYLAKNLDELHQTCWQEAQEIQDRMGRDTARSDWLWEASDELEDLTRGFKNSLESGIYVMTEMKQNDPKMLRWIIKSLKNYTEGEIDLPLMIKQELVNKKKGVAESSLNKSKKTK